jgi:CDP-diacylglycerol--glycerol-3-phosphate 3-phosphatidyltransferase
MVVSKAEGIVIAANIFGKIKTLSQSIGLVLIMLEPLFFKWTGMLVVTYVALAIMVFSTIFSGLSYFKAYWPYIDSNK